MSRSLEVEVEVNAISIFNKAIFSDTVKYASLQNLQTMHYRIYFYIINLHAQIQIVTFDYHIYNIACVNNLN